MIDEATAKEKARLLTRLSEIQEIGSPEYRLILNCLNSLDKIAIEREKANMENLSSLDKIAIEREKAIMENLSVEKQNKIQLFTGILGVLAYLGVSILTVKHEEIGVVTSKVWSTIRPPKM